ncbi:MAG: cellulase family glycosylhydrolase, partial [bacterium]|nr:cellulase family glycosylhydrolase [bacterium]
MIRPLLAVSLETIINISPEVPLINQSVNIKSSLRSSENFTDSIVNFEIYDSSNQKVFQQFFEHQNLSSSQVNNYEFNWTPKNIGKYIVKIGLFNKDWSRLYYWEDKAHTFDISGQPSSSSLATSVKFNPEIPKTNSPTKINVSINPTQTGFDRIIDFEIYDSSNQKVFQQFFEHQNFEIDKTVNYQLSWTPTTQGQYQLRYGIFTSNWQSNIIWNNSLSSINVSSESATVNTSQNTNSYIPSASTASTNLTGSKYEVGKDGRIYKDGQKIILKGVSWFGLESGAHAPHGLWARNWQDMVSQIKSVGFNAVRVPFCPSTLKNVDVSTIEYSKNPDLQGLKSLDILDKVVNELNNKQLYILLDHHTPDCQTISDLWYIGSYSESQWIQDLVFLANRYKNLDYFIGLDIKNEPKGPATWGTGNPATDWNLAAQKAGKEILNNNPNILIFVQGVEN